MVVTWCRLEHNGLVELRSWQQDMQPRHLFWKIRSAMFEAQCVPQVCSWGC